MSETPLVTLTKEEYDRLTDRDWKLSCLEAHGVDNWQGWDDAMQDYEAGEEE